MSTALRLGGIELWRGLPYRGRGFRGRWDFFWLTLLLGLTLTIALLMVAAREGLLDRLLDVSLGVVPDRGVPVWVQARTRNGSEALAPADLARIEGIAPGLSLYPYREVGTGDVALPGEGIWAPLPEDSYGQAGKQVSKPVIWAVSTDDPLWQLALADHPDLARPESGLTNLVVLSALAFWRFDCDSYTSAIRGLEPPAGGLPPIAAGVPPGAPACLADGLLWLNLKPGPGPQEAHPFRIVWMPRLPTLAEVAILFPLDYLHVMKLAQTDGKLHFFPELHGGEGLRINAIEAKPGTEHRIDPATLTGFRECLGVQWRRQRNLYQWVSARPQHRVEECAARVQLRFVTEPLLQSPDPYLLLAGSPAKTRPVRVLETGGRLCVAPTEQTRGDADACDADSGLVAVDPLRGRDYDTALLYVQQRERVVEVVRELEALTAAAGGAATGGQPEALVAIPGPYRDAVNRFGFMAAVVGLLQWPFGVALGLTLAVMSLAQIGIVVEHRQHVYGIYLAKGLSRGGIVGMLLVQVTICLLLGLVVAVTLALATSQWLVQALDRLLKTEAYADRMMVTDLTLLPLTTTDVAWVGGAALLLVWAIALALLYKLLLFRNVEPSRLFCE
jgi:hypothetical protein